MKKIFFLLFLLVTIIASIPKAHSLVWQEDFESGIGEWTIDNGVWEVGDPAVGPESAYSWTNCAGTVLADDYPAYDDSRLISPEIDLPAITGDEELHLSFWHWFSYSSYDIGYVQVSTWDDGTSTWSEWENIGNSIESTSPAWSLMGVDLSAYAGRKVRIAFYHTANRNTSYNPSESTGWYIDDVELVAKVSEFTGDFESGWGDWYSDRGLWEVGAPTAGPSGVHGGTQCVGTVLDGNYSSYTDSRLISPTTVLPAITGDEELHLSFWHWFSYSSYDIGYVQVSTWDDGTSTWSEWENIGNSIESTSPAWSLMGVDLSAYAGRKVRIAFYHTAHRNPSYEASESTGWYIDDVELIAKVPEFTGDFESGWGDWYSDNGLWEVGAPTAGPSGVHGGTECAGTVLDGNYTSWTDSRLISPTTVLPAITGDEELHLNFWHWFSYSSYDIGHVQISTWDDGTSTWADWENVGNSIESTSPAWSLMSVDLSAYAGRKVRIAFYHTAHRNPSYEASESTGWYIDDVGLIAKVPEFTGDFESGWGDWYSDNGLWEVGAPTAGPSGVHGGTQCAGTVLAGNYTSWTDSRLISPTTVLPAITGDEELHLNFWHWFSYSSYDIGHVQISTWDDGTSTWADWENVGNSIESTSPARSLMSVDLSAYAGRKVRIAFYHTAHRNPSYEASESTGWYIDDVQLIVKVPEFTGDFESGWGDWYSDNGLWEVGAPTAGPSGVHGGTQCAGTVLAGNYTSWTDSRLISPTISLPGIGSDEALYFRFWHWFSYSSYDIGYVQVSTWDDGTSTWADWENVGNSVENTSPAWSLMSVDLSAYAGRKVRIAIYHTASRNPSYEASESTGWYIDDVQLIVKVPEFTGDFESGWGDWYSDNGLWEVGAPTAGPSGVHGGTQCAGTVLAGNYTSWTDSRLISPTISLPGIGSDEALYFRFWHWFSYSSYDIGYVQVSTWDDGTSTWSDWENVGNSIESTSPVWSLMSVDLSAYAGRKVRIAFYHTANRSPYYTASESTGWYIDDVQLSHYIPSSISISEDTNGTFHSDDERHYYALEVPPRGHLNFVLDDFDNSGINEVYIRYGALPSPGEYDYRFTSQGGADQEIFIPNAIPGTWYILVIGASVQGDGQYTIRTEFSTGIIMKVISPDHLGNAGPALFTIKGAGFAPTDSISLVGADTLQAQSVSFLSASELIAEFDVIGITTGTYQLQVSSDFSTASMPVQIIDATGASLETRIIVPDRLGYHAIATAYVEYENTGDIAMYAPLLTVSATQNDRQGALLTLDSSRIKNGFWTSAIPEGFSTSVQFIASGATPGLLQPGETGRIPVYYAGWLKPWDFSYPPIYWNLSVLQANSTTSADWEVHKDEMRPHYVRSDAWEAIWSNFTAQAGETWGDYLTMLDQNAIYLSEIGAGTSDITKLLAFSLRQADALNPIRYLSTVRDASMSSPGIELALTRTYAQPISRRYELGSLGRGWVHNWQWLSKKEDDGTVRIIDVTGTPHIYQPDSRNPGEYFGVPGDHDTLTDLPDGALRFLRSDGTAYVFRSDGNLGFIEDTNSNRVTCEYTADMLTGLTHSSGQSLSITYDANNRISNVTDSVGRQTHFSYDESGEHLIAVEAYDGLTTQYSYISGGDQVCEHSLQQIKFPDNSHRYFSYDNHGRLETLSADDNVGLLTFGYNSIGTVTSTNVIGNVSTFCFDDYGQILKSADALGRSMQIGLDKERNVKTVTGPIGHTYNYEYDSQGNLVRLIDPNGGITRLSYSSDFNRLSSLIDAKSNLTEYGYDTKGNLTSITYADGSEESWTYDSVGLPISWTNRRGNTIDFSWDVTGRLFQKTLPDGSTFDYTYDAKGNLAQTSDATGTTTYTYNAQEYLTKIEYPMGQWLQFGYDSGGRRSLSLTQLGHRLDYEYDTAGRLSLITDETEATVVAYSYDEVGRLSRKDLGNGVYTIYSYDDAGQLLRIDNHKLDGEFLSFFEYSYDSRGLRTTMSTNDGNWLYEYDNLGQLTHAVFASANDARIPNQDLTYVYDALGNRIQTIENGVITDYVANKLNQYKTVGDTIYTFDADGNLVEERSPDVTTAYSYDDENRLIAVTRGPDEWAYTYNALGQRVANTKNGVSTFNIIDPVGLGNLVGEYDESGEMVNGYDYGFGLVSHNTTEVTNFYTFDALGNTSELTNITGNILNSYSYEPFGAVLYQSESLSNPFQFVGEFGVMMEGHDLSFMRARVYDPSTGRFTQSDPIGVSGGINLLKYSMNNPIIYIDPNGLSAGCKAGNHIELSPRYSGILLFEGKEVDPKHYYAARNITRKISRLLGHNTAYWVTVTFGQWWEWWQTSQTWWNGWGFPWDTDIDLFSNALGAGSAMSDVDLLSGTSYCAPSEDPTDPPSAPGEPGGDGESPASGSADPNELIGPSGYSSLNYVQAADILTYRINFENEESAAAPAQIVTISNQLSADFDWTTFELTEIAFGDQFIAVPANTQHFTTVEKMTYNGVSFEVHIDAGIHLATGEVYAQFTSIDPVMGLPPAVDIGFLPPEDGTGCGQGHISYVIKFKENLDEGTEVRNIALIVFDGQPGIPTNLVDPHDPSKGTDPEKEAPVMVDNRPPVSSVDPLPEVMHKTDIPVFWSGHDSYGSGVAGFDVYVSVDGGPFQVWLDGTTATSAIYAAQDRQQLEFYCVAYDNVGYKEAPPTYAQAFTEVIVPPTAIPWILLLLLDD